VKEVLFLRRKIRVKRNYIAKWRENEMDSLLKMEFLDLGTHLFVKVPRPGDSEVTFSVFESSCSSCHLLLPV